MMLLALLIAVFLAGLAVVSTGTGSGRFQSRAILLIDQPGLVAESTADGVLLKLSRLRVKYVDVSGTSIVLERAAAETDIPVEVLRASTSVIAPPISLTLVATASAATRDDAIVMANAVADAMAAFAADEQAFNQIPPDHRVQLSVIEPAATASRVGESRSRPLTVGVLTSLVAFVLAYAGIQIVTARQRT